MKKISDTTPMQRRGFFSLVGKSAAAGAVVSAVFPLRIFSGQKNAQAQNVAITEHPMAVKRTKKG